MGCSPSPELSSENWGCVSAARELSRRRFILIHPTFIACTPTCPLLDHPHSPTFTALTTSENLYKYFLIRRAMTSESKVTSPDYTKHSELAYDSSLFFWRAVISIFFREIRPRGAYNIPKDGPVIFVGAPHHNQVCSSQYTHCFDVYFLNIRAIVLGSSSLIV